MISAYPVYEEMSEHCAVAGLALAERMIGNVNSPEDRCDYSAIIDRGIKARVRHELAHFLVDFEISDDGVERQLTGAELALVKSVLESFFMHGELISLGLNEVDCLTERLSRHAGEPELFPIPHRLRNDCFDAAACIRALEVKAMQQAHANDILREHLVMLSHHKKQGERETE